MIFIGAFAIVVSVLFLFVVIAELVVDRLIGSEVSSFGEDYHFEEPPRRKLRPKLKVDYFDEEVTR